MRHWTKTISSALAMGTIGLAPAWAADAPPQTPPASSNAPSVDVSLPDIDIVSQRLDQARSELQPSLGATVYHFGPAQIQAIPQGDNAPLNQLLLQAPGVAQDSYGQIHVRGDHDEVQYRLDGVMLPEGLSVFGQALETRFAHSLSLITGALPAQYGFDTAAVVDITTKSGTTDPGGEISLYGGARDYFEPSFSYGGHAGSVDYFVTGDLLNNRVGIENPTSGFNAVHDLSTQTHGLIHLSDVIDENTRISLLAGTSNEFFQIPNNPNQAPSGFSVNGIDTADSADLTEHQREITNFGILSLQKEIGNIDLQTSVFTRYSSLYYTPDPLGDLLFDGISQTAARSVLSNGEQTDLSWKLNNQHTLRAGFQVTAERTVASTQAQVLPLDANGNQISDQPINVDQGSGKTGGLYGAYLQDEWRILKSLTLNYGARFDAVDEFTHEQQLSPRVNLVFKPTDTTTLHGGYSRYFTPPPFELVSGNTLAAFANTSAAPGTAQDSTVKAEHDNYYDVGIDQIILPGLRVGVDAYYKQARNLIDEGQFGAPIILTAFNYAQGEDHGVEFTTNYDHGPHSVYGNFAVSRAIGKDIDSAQFNFSPAELAYIGQHWIYLDHNQTYSGSAGYAYTFNKGESDPLRLSADLIVGSGLRADTATVPNGRALPTYATINLSAVQTIHSGFGTTELRMDVLNLFDSSYEIRDGTGVGVGAPQYGLRRTILAGLTQRF